MTSDSHWKWAARGRGIPSRLWETTVKLWKWILDCNRDCDMFRRCHVMRHLPRKAHRENGTSPRESWRSRAIQTLWYGTWRPQDLVLALMGLVWLWSSLSHVLIPPFWNGNGYSILWEQMKSWVNVYCWHRRGYIEDSSGSSPWQWWTFRRRGSELWQSLPLGPSVNTDSVYRKCPP